MPISRQHCFHPASLSNAHWTLTTKLFGMCGYAVIVVALTALLCCQIVRQGNITSPSGHSIIKCRLKHHHATAGSPVKALKVVPMKQEGQLRNEVWFTCCIWSHKYQLHARIKFTIAIHATQILIPHRLNHDSILPVEAVFLGSDKVHACVAIAVSPLNLSVRRRALAYQLIHTNYVTGVLCNVCARYIQMPWCEGGDLFKWSPPSIAHAKEVLRQTLRVRHVQG